MILHHVINVILYLVSSSSYFSHYILSYHTSDEVGHNLGFGHSNENAVTYRDQSGMMGFSYDQDDGPVMCFKYVHSLFDALHKMTLSQHVIIRLLSHLAFAVLQSLFKQIGMSPPLKSLHQPKVHQE